METKKTKEEVKTKTVTMPANDWAILQNHLQLLAENIGKIGLLSKDIGIVHSNTTYFIQTISEQTK